MESAAAREMNLMDMAQRIEKIISDAVQNRDRIIEAGDILMGTRPCDPATGSATPMPSALLHRIGQSLGILENIVVSQRQEINRVHAGLQEAPPKSLGEPSRYPPPPNGNISNIQQRIY